MANLGDGNGWVNQAMELRQNYRVLGTCGETFFGGNHLRMWRQNGTNATTNALFLAYVDRFYFIFFSLIMSTCVDSVSEEEVSRALSFLPRFGT